MLAIVVPIGTVILTNGTQEINAFNNSMANSLNYTNAGIQEDLIFEHVRFDPLSSEVMISIRNTGTVVTTIDRITLVNMTNQDILFKIDAINTFAPLAIPIKNSVDFTITANGLEGNVWGAAGTLDGKEYKISLITTRGNFFDLVARPYNT